MQTGTFKQIRLEATGETVTFTQTASDTNGEYLEFICFLPAGEKAAPPKHIHPFQSEYFESLEGSLGVFIKNKKKVLLAGQSEEVPPNTRHGWYAAENSALTFKTIFRPALDMEWLLTETFASMNRARSSRPPLFEACYIITQMKGQFYLANVPVAVQKILFPVVAALGKSLGLVKKVKPRCSPFPLTAEGRKGKTGIQP